MKRIRFIQIGNYKNSTIDNLTQMLNCVQDVYEFVFDEEPLVVGTEKMSPDGTFPPKYLEGLIKDYMHVRQFTEYPVGITDIPLPEEIASSNDDKLAILSTHGWSSYSSHPLIKGLAYWTASLILDLHLATETHYDTRACPNDFCDNRHDLNLGMERAEFCEECQRAIISALETGRITQREVVAVLRMLDYVGGRKICFVLMPFKGDFAEPYSAIKAAVDGAGFTCKRADEIFETRSIVQIIYEFIGRSELIIADLTGRNANVFYELGYAHALGKSTILLTQNPEDVPFDLRHRQYIVYAPDNLQETLGNKVRAYFPRNLGRHTQFKAG